jgi:hypothetical protein
LIGSQFSVRGRYSDTESFKEWFYYFVVITV